MIRIKGFARKTRRLTKGGSLPENNQETSDRNIHSEDPSGIKHAGNGSEPATVNRSEHVNRGEYVGRHASTNSANESNGRSSPTSTRLTRYLHSVMSGLVSSQRTHRRNSSSGSNGLHAPSPVDNQPVLQTLFARATSAFPLETQRSAGTRTLPRWKRILDVSFILLAVPVWLPLLVLVMLWIRLVSPGPIFYRQERVGYRRSRFMIFKFRTMHVNAETRSHEEYFAHLMRHDCPMTKLDAADDSRLVRCGRFLRASGLDELPQIFNVLRGEMSLVGPRPCLPNEFERYQPWHRRRVNAPPGLTGYWQVNGKNKTTFSQMIAMDILYAKRMSFWLDLTIMLKTVPALISQTIESRGARADLPMVRELPVHGSNGSTKI